MTDTDPAATAQAIATDADALLTEQSDAVDDDGVLVGRTHREAPEIDGFVRVHADWARPGALVRAHVTEAIGPDLVAKAARPKGSR